MNNEGAFVVLVFVIAFAIAMIPMIFYILTLQNTLQKVHEKNRKMQPTEAWLLLIPLFNLIWHFIVVNRMADSLAAEFKMRNINVGQARPGYEVGLAYCICTVCSIVPILGILAAFGSLVLWIVYWVKINEYKNKLAGPFDPSTAVTSESEEWFKE